MTIEEIFNEVAAHMYKGVLIHKAMMEAFEFLSLAGYSKCQEYHYLEENDNYLNILHYYLITYQRLIKSKEIEIDIIPSSWYRYAREDVDNSTRKNAIKDLMSKWVNWEKDTKNFLQQMYKELETLNEIAAATFINEYILQVEKELSNAQQKQLELETIGYDLVEIIDEQASYYHKYCKKLKKRK